VAAGSTAGEKKTLRNPNLKDSEHYHCPECRYFDSCCM